MRTLILKIVVISCTMLGGLSSVFGAVTLAWDQSPDASFTGAVAGYKIYYGPMMTEIVTMGMETNAVAALLEPNRLYNFTVCAFDGLGRESEYSNFLPFFSPTETRTNVTLTWDHSSDRFIAGGLAGYKMRYGYATKIKNVGLNTRITVTDLDPGKPYFFAVTAYSRDGLESEPSNIAFHMNSIVDQNNPDEELAPPVMAAFSFGPSINSNNPGNSSNPKPNSSLIIEDVLGVPPVIIPTVTSNSTQLTVWGSLGANLTVQRNANIGTPGSWTTVTNITLDTVVQSEGTQFGSTIPPLIQKAFAPSIATWQMELPSSPVVLYRLIQQQDYEVLAEQTLKNQGYTPRLVVVRLAGNTSYTLCYVTEEKAFIHYDAKTQTITRQSAGEGLREIADSVSALLQVNWTSASEFVMAGNQRQIRTTVFKTPTASLAQPK